MPAADRTRRSPLACLLVALALALGLSGAAQMGAGAGGGHPMVTAASGVPGPQAVLDLHAQPRLGAPRADAAAVPSALLVILLLGRRLRRIPARAARGAPGRPPRGGRAPPASPPVQGPLTAEL
ncbi:hypothetical protein [Actinoallomurus iriomotensis]|uniref:Uncharacterized protein n=1 Tax=Actinoallomurus iriomotensis TaxID=478107 RepID=A0A9W6RPA9_9ACTN|nr:hypothetical protein [Actinoallomurus iriomotensis]GLY77470.1 hypothetical protein Airi01_057370 [Actinoallomurus iriomotensis]